MDEKIKNKKIKNLKIKKDERLSLRINSDTKRKLKELGISPQGLFDDILAEFLAIGEHVYLVRRLLFHGQSVKKMP